MKKHLTLLARRCFVIRGLERMDMGYLWLVQVLALELEELKDKDYWQLVATLAKSKEMASS